MKKNVIILIGLLVIIYTSNGQWVVNNDHQVLTEKISNLRDFKIFPEQNLMIAVDNLNYIYRFDYTSGELIKKGRANIIDTTNEYARFSSDGKSLITFHNKNNMNENYPHKIFQIDPITFQQRAKGILPYGLLAHDGYLISESMTFCDVKDNIIMIAFSYSSLNVSGESQSRTQSGYVSKFRIQDTTITFIKNILGMNPKEIILKDKNSFDEFFFLGQYNNSYSRTHVSSGTSMNIAGIYKKDSLYQLFKTEYSQSDNTEYGNNKHESSGYYIHLYQSFNLNDSLYYMVGNNKVYTFNINSKKLTDSIFGSNFLIGGIFLTNQNNYIHTVVKDHYLIYSNHLPKNIYRFGDSTMKISRILIANSDYGDVYLLANNNQIIKLSPNIIKPNNPYGFVWDKDTVEVGEPVEFYSLNQCVGCKYNWIFENNQTIISDEPLVKYNFGSDGFKSVQLSITRNNEQLFEFTKKDIINVYPKLIPIFDVEYLSEQKPYRVKLINKSLGNYDKVEWVIGNEIKSTENNPIIELTKPGFYNVKLTISNDKFSKILLKYDFIMLIVEKFQIAEVDKIFSFGNNQPLKKSFIINNSFLFAYYSYKTNNLTTYYRFSFYLDYYNYDFDSNLKNSFKLLNVEFDSTYEDTKYHPFFTWQFVNYDNKNFITPTYSDYKCVFKKYDLENFANSKSYEKKFNYLGEAWPFEDNRIIVIEGKKFYSYDTLMTLNLEKSISDSAKTPKFYDTLSREFVMVERINYNTISYKKLNIDGEKRNQYNLTLDSSYRIISIKAISQTETFIFGKFYSKLYDKFYGFIGKIDNIGQKISIKEIYCRNEISQIVKVKDNVYIANGSISGQNGYLQFDKNLEKIEDYRIENMNSNIQNILVDKLYFYLVAQVLNENGSNPIQYTNVYRVKIKNDTNDIPDIQSSNVFKFSIFPNPADDFIEISIPSLNNGLQSLVQKVQIFNTLGIEVLSVVAIHELPLPRIDISHLPTGVYLIKIGDRVEKFVKK